MTMKILEANIYGYGCFIDRHFDISNDFQVITGENESGKSTFKSFVSSILFGFPTKREKNENYVPKKGSIYGGNLVVLQHGQKYLIERINSDKSNSLSIVNKQNGEKIPESLLKKWLSGIDKQLFNEIYAVNQTGLHAILDLKPNELERNFYSIATSGSQEIFEMQKKFLKAAGELYKPNGRVPKINVMLKNYDRQQKNLQHLINRVDESKQLEEKIVELQEQNLLFQQEKGKYEQQISELQQLISSWDSYQEILSTSKMVTGDKVKIKLAVFEKMQLQNNKINAIEETLNSLEKQMAHVKSQLDEKNFAELGFYLRNKDDFDKLFVSLSSSKKQSERATDNTEILSRRSKNSKNSEISLVFLGILGISILILFFVSNTVVKSIGLIGIIAGIYGFSKTIKKVSGNESDNRPEQTTKQNNFDFCKEELGLSTDYPENLKRILNFQNQIKEQQNHRDEYEAKKRFLIQEQNDKLSKLRREQIQLDTQLKEFGYDSFAALRNTYFQQQNQIETESRLYGLKSQIPSGLIGKLKRYSSRNEIEEEKSSISNEFKLKKDDYDKRLELVISYKIQLEKIGDSNEIAVLQQEAANQRAQINTKIEEWLALSLTDRWLDDYLGKLSKNRLPQVIKLATNFFKRLTRGHFTSIILKESQFILQASDNQSFRVTELSRATAEQLYLSLRLAFVVTFNKKIGLPIIIDDGFVNFDRQRKFQIIDLLLEISTETQILCFTVDISAICDKVSNEGILVI